MIAQRIRKLLNVKVRQKSSKIWLRRFMTVFMIFHTCKKSSAENSKIAKKKKHNSAQFITEEKLFAD